MKTINLIFMSFDGEYITDSRHENIESAQQAFENIGSKWFFYPFGFILSGQRVVEPGIGLIRMSDNKAYSKLMFKGRKLQTVIKAFKKTYALLEEEDKETDCYEFESIMIDTNRNLIR